MARIAVFHWKPAEAGPLVDALKRGGHRVELCEKMADYRRVREVPPDAIVIDLSRMPSQGREVGVFFRGAKKTRHVPLVYVGGEPEKVEKNRKVLPDATYTSLPKVRSAVKEAIAHPPENPFVPTQMMDRFADRTAAQKIGIGKDYRVFVVDPPVDYARAVGKLPEGASYDEESSEGCAVTLWFVRDLAEFHSMLPRMRKLAACSRLWILWRKGKQDGLDGNLIRESAMAFGLVDYKVCSVDKTWTGMVFAVKKTTAPAP